MNNGSFLELDPCPHAHFTHGIIRGRLETVERIGESEFDAPRNDIDRFLANVNGTAVRFEECLSCTFADA